LRGWPARPGLAALGARGQGTVISDEWRSWTPLGLAAWDTQLETLKFDGAGRTASAGGDGCIGELAQKRHFRFRPGFPKGIPRWKSNLVAAGSHRDTATTEEPRQILIRHRAQQIQFAWRPRPAKRNGANP
jgi:hypothetical protein